MSTTIVETAIVETAIVETAIVETAIVETATAPPPVPSGADKDHPIDVDDDESGESCAGASGENDSDEEDPTLVHCGLCDAKTPLSRGRCSTVGCTNVFTLSRHGYLYDGFVASEGSDDDVGSHGGEIEEEEFGSDYEDEDDDSDENIEGEDDEDSDASWSPT
jgi:hypothetical protein